ncbi:MAG: hypothetical protein ACI86H_000873 [bacterium]|jgi:hypothetical protein
MNSSQDVTQLHGVEQSRFLLFCYWGTALFFTSIFITILVMFFGSERGAYSSLVSIQFFTIGGGVSLIFSLGALLSGLLAIFEAKKNIRWVAFPLLIHIITFSFIGYNFYQ